MNKAYYITAENLAKLGLSNIPEELQSAKHMIYSSPATLDFNSPGARGFGVKRAGLAIPESVMLLIAPGCCGRNTALLNEIGYHEKFFYLLLDDTDIVTGRYLNKISQACTEILEELTYRPSAIMLCVTCVDALLGTDMDRICKNCEAATGVPSVPAYMYALTREKRIPPMGLARKSVYSLLKPQTRFSKECNILGYFSPLDSECELYDLLRSFGMNEIREISRCKTFSAYTEMSRANFNLVLNAEARYAAQDMQDRLGIPFIELTRMYRIEKIKNQYRLLAQALGAKINQSSYYEKCDSVISNFRKEFGDLTFAIGESLNADSFELALALTEYGFHIAEIYGTIGERNYVYIKKLAMQSPNTRIYSNLSPTMMCYERDCHIDVVVGGDAKYYHKDLPGIHFNHEEQPFGYRGVELLFSQLTDEIRKYRH